VFVFAVTQLSHSLLAHLTVAGALHVRCCCSRSGGVVYTSWVTNFLDPERSRCAPSVRADACGLLLSSSIPDAFGARGLMFASAYVFMQVGRACSSLGDPALVAQPAPQLPARAGLVAGLGRVLDRRGAGASEQRPFWWTLALALEIVSRVVYFWVPGLGRSTIADWAIDGGPLPNGVRCS